MTALEARARRAQKAAEMRQAQMRDALHFLLHGHDAHAEKCVHALAGGEPCSRDYDPRPYPEATPGDLRMYDGTGIGALYGQRGEVVSAFFDDEGRGSTIVRSLAAELAGWNVRAQPGRERLRLRTRDVRYDAFGGVDALGAGVAA